MKCLWTVKESAYLSQLPQKKKKKNKTLKQWFRDKKHKLKQQRWHGGTNNGEVWTKFGIVKCNGGWETDRKKHMKLKFHYLHLEKQAHLSLTTDLRGNRRNLGFSLWLKKKKKKKTYVHICIWDNLIPRII